MTCLTSLSFSHFLSLTANRRAGHAVTNILAKELMQEDTAPRFSKPPNKNTKMAQMEEPSIEGAGSLEDLLEDSLSRSN